MYPQLTIQSGRVLEADWVPSPNFGSRPSATPIDLLVIHNISLPPNQFGGGYVQPFFQNRLDPELDPYFAQIYQLRVSSHLLIERTGRLTQFVNLNDRAWHAGKSEFEGRSECNDFSIGIELEGSDTQPFDDCQYQTLEQLTCAIQEQYAAITADRICGHSDIAPGRKSDPGPCFDWERYFASL